MTREERYIEYDERIDRYLRNQMDDNERTTFEQDVDNDQELRERLVATAMLVKGIAEAGMQREGQAQLNAIKQMTRDRFIQATRGNKSSRPMWSFMKWAAGFAVVAFMAYGIYTLYPTTSTHQVEMTEVVQESHASHKMTTTEPVKPTLARLAEKYNKPFDNEPAAFISIREQIQQGSTKEMMAVVDEIDRIEWPTTNHEPKGASDDIVFKETLSNYNDFTHWYKALAYLKADDKESAIKELNEIIDHSTVEELVSRASDLLKKLKK